MGEEMIAEAGGHFIQAVGVHDCAELWDAYVDSHPRGSVFHLSDTIRSFDDAKNHSAFACAAINSADEIVALVSAVKIATLKLGGKMTSRSVCFAEPICDDSEEGRHGLRVLIDKLDRSLGRESLFTEVRPIHDPGVEQHILTSAGYEFESYLNYVVDTTFDADVLWKRLSKSSRNKIRRSCRRGVEIRRDESDQGVEVMHELVCESYRRSRMPTPPLCLFRAAKEHLGDRIQIRIASHDGRDVAAGIGLVYRDRFYAWYGGGLRLSSIVPFDCLTWDEIEWSASHGLAHYDFGGAGWPDEPYGPRDFKAKFKGDLVSYGRYRKAYYPARLRVAEAAFNTLRRLGSLRRGS